MNRDPNYRFSLPQTDDWLIGCREINLAPSTHVPVVDSKLRQKVTLKKKSLLPDYSYMICTKSNCLILAVIKTKILTKKG